MHVVNLAIPGVVIATAHGLRRVSDETLPRVRVTPRSVGLTMAGALAWSGRQ